MRTYNVLNVGAGVQSSRILLAMCRDELPKPDAAIFSDTRWEPAAVYENLSFLRGESEKAGIPFVVVSAGSIREEILSFMQTRTLKGRKRYASAPFFIANQDGSQGRMRRQCTPEYKIEPINAWIRKTLLGMQPKQRIPAGVMVRQWFGISDDESRRAAFPGQWKTRKTVIGNNLLGESLVRSVRAWRPARWRLNVYPLLNEVWTPDRRIITEDFLPSREQRQDCLDWLAKHYPGQTFPRSACIGCPFRSNSEWKEMRDTRPDEWEDACNFDDLQRQADAASASRRTMLVGIPYVHRQMVPLRMADLDGDGERGGGCGTLFDGMDGLCDV